MTPDNVRYAETHEWAKLDGDICTVGISQYAVDELSDLVAADFKAVGTKLKAKDEFGEIEAVKAVGSLYAPVDGEIVEVNEAVVDDVEIVSEDPYGKGWLVKLKVTSGTTLDHLKTAEEYKKQIDSEEH